MLMPVYFSALFLTKLPCKKQTKKKSIYKPYFELSFKEKSFEFQIFRMLLNLCTYIHSLPEESDLFSHQMMYENITN